jgi:GNAT superfamily N-acetyltransferase
MRLRDQWLRYLEVERSTGHILPPVPRPGRPLRGSGAKMDGVDIRERRDEDVSALESLAQLVHAGDGYPLYLPTDLRHFLVGPAAHGAWVVEEEEKLLGHVALHHRSWEGVMDLACQATGLAEDSLAVVARLLVSPGARRRGIGRALLETATRKARHLGLNPILDVAVRYEAANRLYQAEGWQCLGTVRFPIPDGTTVDEYVYLGPMGGSPAGPRPDPRAAT